MMRGFFGAAVLAACVGLVAISAHAVARPISNKTHSYISAVWANDGEDKVTQDELRASQSPSVTNSVWNGSKVTLFGAKNEVVSFDLVLEAQAAQANGVSVTLTGLKEPSGSVIRYAKRSKSNLFNWTGTESELFYIRYLQILGLSTHFYGALGDAQYQEPTFPQRAQCPPPTSAGCLWAQRPVANKFYPDISVPIELVPSFSIAQGTNQSIWADIYIPKQATSGTYTGSAEIFEFGVLTHKIPVTLVVRNFTLPDTPTSKTMLATGYGDLRTRYGNNGDSTTSNPTLIALKNQMLLAHRHRISIIDDDMGTGGGWVGPGEWTTGVPAPGWIPFLNGTGFTRNNGYAGPGVGVGNGVFAVGIFGSMSEFPAGTGISQSQFTSNLNAWESWFEKHSPQTDRFVYLCDETDCTDPSKPPSLETQLGWWAAITGPGRLMHTMATQCLLNVEPASANGLPAALSDPTSSWPFSRGTGPNCDQGGYTSADQAAVDSVLLSAPNRDVFAYNGQRPGSGSFGIEDEGTALREIPWGQFKKNIARWFFWEATFYNNNQGGTGPTDVFNTAQTIGSPPDPNYPNTALYGQIAYNAANGDGVLFYPGTDLLFPNSSYGIAGPIASLRLKHWRRGIQDVDYIALAMAIDPTTTTAIVNRMVPSVLWEAQCPDPATQCQWNHSPVRWSNKPDDWETARAQLAHIIDGQ
jgi:hypothetical protein